MPIREPANSSSGSPKSASSRRHRTRIGADAVDGAHVDAVAMHDEVPAFEKQQAEIAGEIGVFVIGLVMRPRRQQSDPRDVGSGQR